MRIPLIPPLCVRPPSRAFAVRICGMRFPCACCCCCDGGASDGYSSSSGSAAGNGYCTCASWCGAGRGVLTVPAPAAPFFDFDDGGPSTQTPDRTRQVDLEHWQVISIEIHQNSNPNTNPNLKRSVRTLAAGEHIRRIAARTVFRRSSISVRLLEGRPVKCPHKDRLGADISRQMTRHGTRARDRDTWPPLDHTGPRHVKSTSRSGEESFLGWRAPGPVEGFMTRKCAARTYQERRTFNLPCDRAAAAHTRA